MNDGRQARICIQKHTFYIKESSTMPLNSKLFYTLNVNSIFTLTVIEAISQHCRALVMNTIPRVPFIKDVKILWVPSNCSPGICKNSRVPLHSSSKFYGCQAPVAPVLTRALTLISPWAHLTALSAVSSWGYISSII